MSSDQITNWIKKAKALITKAKHNGNEKQIPITRFFKNTNVNQVNATNTTTQKKKRSYAKVVKESSPNERFPIPINEIITKQTSRKVLSFKKRSKINPSPRNSHSSITKTIPIISSPFYKHRQSNSLSKSTIS